MRKRTEPRLIFDDIWVALVIYTVGKGLILAIVLVRWFGWRWGGTAFAGVLVLLATVFMAARPRREAVR